VPGRGGPLPDSSALGARGPRFSPSRLLPAPARPCGVSPRTPRVPRHLCGSRAQTWREVQGSSCRARHPPAAGRPTPAPRCLRGRSLALVSSVVVWGAGRTLSSSSAAWGANHSSISPRSPREDQRPACRAAPPAGRRITPGRLLRVPSARTSIVHVAERRVVVSQAWYRNLE